MYKAQIIGENAEFLQAMWDYMGGDERMNQEFMKKGVSIMKAGYKFSTKQ